MSAIGDAVGAIRDALRLADDVKRAGDALSQLAHELREHDRRITRLEAQWETAIALSKRRRSRGVASTRTGSRRTGEASNEEGL